MSYESPIVMFAGNVQADYENGIIKAVQNVGFNVNKEELIKALQYDRGQYEKGFTDGRPKWISVKEKLPVEEESKYWVCTDTGYQCQCRWTNANPFWTDLTTDWHWNHFDVPQYSKVVAWMPLPEPWKGENR